MTINSFIAMASQFEFLKISFACGKYLASKLFFYDFEICERKHVTI